MQAGKLQLMMEVAICAALAVVFDSIVLFTAPQGGSVSLVMLPVFLIAFRHGVKAGVLTGLLLGVLQMIFKVYYVHPIQVLLDYALAFTGIGLAGVFMNPVKRAFASGQKKLGIVYMFLGALLGSSARFLCHFVAGIVFYGSFAPEGTPVALYSLVYNAWYMIPSFLISVAILNILVATAPLLINVKRNYSLR